MELVTVLIFAAFFTLAYGAYGLSSRREVKERLARLADGSRVAVPQDTNESGVLLTDESGFFARALAVLAGRAVDSAAPRMSAVRERLVQAGFRRESHVAIYVGSRIGLAVLLPVTLLFSSVVWALSDLQVMVLLGSAVAVGYVAPSYWLDKKRSARQGQIILGLPDALDLMVVCVEAGLGISASLARVAREFARNNPVLSAEFELATLEIRAGKSSTNALRALAQRTGVSEVGSLVAMLVQTERFGTSLADALRVHAEGMRVQRMQRAEEQAAKAPLKMLFPTLIIFIATLVVTLGPGLLQLFSFFTEKGA